MNVAQLAKRLLVYVDIRSLTEAASTGTEYLDDVVTHINLAAQELYSLAPPYVSNRPLSVTLNAPASVQVLDATAGSSEAGEIVGFEDWMIGATFVIAGAAPNRLLSYTDTPSPASVFVSGLPGSGTLAGTCYASAAILPDEVIQIGKEPYILNSHILTPRNQDVYRRDYGRRTRITPVWSEGATGTPIHYWIETLNDSATGKLLKFFRVSPMPTGQVLVNMTARVAPPEIVVADLDAANDGAATTKVIPVPNGWHESYLLPIALFHYMGSPFFKNSDVKQSIAARYTAALNHLQSLQPQADNPTSLLATT
jgi:hypothetical protein